MRRYEDVYNVTGEDFTKPSDPGAYFLGQYFDTCFYVSKTDLQKNGSDAVLYADSPADGLRILSSDGDAAGAGAETLILKENTVVLYRARAFCPALLDDYAKEQNTRCR